MLEDVLVKYAVKIKDKSMYLTGMLLYVLPAKISNPVYNSKVSR